MDVREFERIKRLIKEAEIENAKTQGVIDSIKKNWKERFGTDDIDTIKKKLDELVEEKKSVEARMENIYNKLLNSCNWDALEETLND